MESSPPSAEPPPLLPTGAKRGWHLRPALLRSWSIVAGAVLVLAVLIVGFVQDVKRQTQDKTVMSNLHGLAAAADQYFLESPTMMASRSSGNR